MNSDADRHVLFGLLALQNGMVNHVQLDAAFGAWKADKSRSVAEYLEAGGDLSSRGRALVEGLAEVHVEAHGGDVERSLAAISAGSITRECLARLDDADIDATLDHVRPAHDSTAEVAFARATSYAVGSTTSGGQRFRVLRPHARGGLGAVFVALDAELNREVALKQILDHHADDAMSRQRFLIEAEITGGLEHPGIVPVYGLGTYDGGRPYYAMRFIKGDSLKEAIERFHEGAVSQTDPGRRSLELRKLLHRFMDVCNAIDYAHSRGVLHRDIKPGNIIVGKYGETLVVDWGLAKPLGRVEPVHEGGERALVPSSASGSAETLPGSALGTPAYMSPEQARGELDRLGGWSDVYSLGGTLFCLLTGRAPFEGDDLGELLRKVQRGDLVRPRSLDPALDPALEAVCLKAMAHRADERYPSCRALADDVERWLADEPVSAWREPLPRRARRWARRNRTAVTSLAASVLMALVGTGAVLAVQTQANAKLMNANHELEIANGRVMNANNDLKAANAREKERFDLAMEAIRLFHGEVGNDLVLKADRFKPFRDRLLREAADFYGKLEGLLKGQTDRASMAALGNAYYELGELTSKIGDKPAALAAHREGLAARRVLAAEPGAARSRGDVAESLHAVALLLSQTGKRPEALTRLEEARDLLERLPISGPGADGRRALLGTVHLGIARILAAAGKATLATAAYQRSVETLTSLAEKHPGVTDFWSRLADSHHSTGVFKYQSGKPAEALDSYRRAVTINEKLTTANPAAAEIYSALARSHNNIGVLLAQTGKPIEALESYRRALAIFQKLSDDNPAVTEFRNRLASIFNNIGILEWTIGKPHDALLTYGRAVTSYQKLAEDNPTVTEYRFRLADTLHNIYALHLDNGNPVEAADPCRRALAIYQKLASDNPGVTQYRSGVAEKLSDLGGLQARAGDAIEALKSYRSSLTIQQELADKDPAVTEFRSRLAAQNNEIGNLQWATSGPADAVRSYQRALAIYQKLADENPGVTDHRYRLARTHGRIGRLWAHTGRPVQSLEPFGRELPMLKKLADDNPNLPVYHESLASCEIDVADALRRLGHNPEARAGYDRAIAIRERLVRENPTVTKYRAGLAASMRRRGLARRGLGDVAGMLADTRQALEIEDGLPLRSGEDWFETACGHAALAALARRSGSGVSADDSPGEADRAVALLTRAVGMGFRNPDYYRSESALDGLRGRPDFVVLMLDLVFPVDPFSPEDR